MFVQHSVVLIRKKVKNGAFVPHTFSGRFWGGKGIALFPGHSQILSRSRGEKSGEGLLPILRHGPEMVDSVSDGKVPSQYATNTASN